MKCVADFDPISSDATGADPVLLHGPDFPDYRLVMILVLMSKMLSETDFVGLGHKSLHGAMQRGPLVLITNCDKIYLVTKWIQ